jgi:hypothetical protein
LEDTSRQIAKSDHKSICQTKRQAKARKKPMKREVSRSSLEVAQRLTAGLSLNISAYPLFSVEGRNMGLNELLVHESLQETLWRLEEARVGFRSKSDGNVQEALDWVLTRQGLDGAYCNLFSPTDLDLNRGLRLLTGELITSGAALRHILGEEALRTTIVWGLKSSSAVKQALEGFNQILERGGRSGGTYCCYNCTIAFLRTLTAAKPEEWDTILQKGLSAIEEARTNDGKWHGYPFYYTLLMLSDLDADLARSELRHASKAAEKLLKRYGGDDRTSRFRRLALEATLSVT